ncbi:hypothetical protein VCUG_00253 [Vavraia culicis subsp. floridensis]|uniref:Uncharacterized protein n=1 Tax=Vavraia culicis (isolate floridensis) TaxID=948595 RepID=L2GXX1_VAVCU|nr:uncharacterized protein VCUG_00253 [Vavraia culicis subsp. floridensis]ELA48212.1 hypothetical protein VCUG_00253 [Vavraia culicis subsp. floridensis]
MHGLLSSNSETLQFSLDDSPLDNNVAVRIGEVLRDRTDLALFVFVLGVSIVLLLVMIKYFVLQPIRFLNNLINGPAVHRYYARDVLNATMNDANLQRLSISSDEDSSSTRLLSPIFTGKKNNTTSSSLNGEMEDLSPENMESDLMSPSIVDEEVVFSINSGRNMQLIALPLSNSVNVPLPENLPENNAQLPETMARYPPSYEDAIAEETAVERWFRYDSLWLHDSATCSSRYDDIPSPYEEIMVSSHNSMNTAHSHVSSEYVANERENEQRTSSSTRNESSRNLRHRNYEE